MSTLTLRRWWGTAFRAPLGKAPLVRAAAATAPEPWREPHRAPRPPIEPAPLPAPVSIYYSVVRLLS